jgi:hypothetical protein
LYSRAFGFCNEAGQALMPRSRRAASHYWILSSAL